MCMRASAKGHGFARKKLFCRCNNDPSTVFKISIRKLSTGIWSSEKKSNAVLRRVCSDCGSNQFSRICLLRMLKNILAASCFNRFTVFHDHNSVRHCPYGIHVMRDKNITQVSFLLNFQQQFYNLRLNRYADVGSSKISNCGFRIKALAMAILCLCPPENSCGYLARSETCSPVSAKTCRTRSCRSSRLRCG